MLYYYVLFFINQLNLNFMLKYALVENALTLNPNRCVAAVSSPETKVLTKKSTLPPFRTVMPR